MDGTYEDMMTPEQARMMYAALLDKLPLNSPAAQSIGAGAGLPLELLSAQPPTDQTAAAAATAPVVTEGTAAQLPVPPIPPSEAPSAAPSEAPPDQTDPLGRLRSLIGGGERPSQEDRGRESLMNFFFSMAASRNPSFFGQLGEAGQALAQADRAARTEARQERQLDVEAAYRAAAEARQLREAAAMEDPSTPRGRLLNAQAAQAEATAAYYARRPAGEGGSQRGSFVQMQETLPDGTRRTVWYNPTTGQRRDAPPGLESPRSAEQEYRQAMLEDQRYLGARNMAEQIITRDALRNNLPPNRRQEEVDKETRRILEGRPSVTARQSAQQPTAPTEPQTRPGDITIPFVRP